MARKAHDYLATGSVAVGAIHPRSETARIYTRGGETLLAAGGLLRCPELLGDFELRLGDLWR